MGSIVLKNSVCHLSALLSTPKHHLVDMMIQERPFLRINIAEKQRLGTGQGVFSTQ